MVYNPYSHHRRSIRLPGYDYGQDGQYFITINTKHRVCYFGDVIDGKMVRNEFGEIAHKEWLKTAEMRTNVLLDEFIVMPNHIHCIIFIKDLPNPDANKFDIHKIQPGFKHTFGPQSKNLFAIIKGFKSAVTKQINAMQQEFHFQWQRRFHDHIIRDENELTRIRFYIKNNPANWHHDHNNPDSPNFSDKTTIY